MQINVLPTSILDQKEDFCAVCLGSEKLTLKAVTVLSEIAADLIKVVLAFYGNVPLKGHVPDLCGVVPYVQFPGKVRYILFIPVCGQVVVDLFPAVCDDFKIL